MWAQPEPESPSPWIQTMVGGIARDESCRVLWSAACACLRAIDRRPPTEAEFRARGCDVRSFPNEKRERQVLSQPRPAAGAYVESKACV